MARRPDSYWLQKTNFVTRLVPILCSKLFLRRCPNLVEVMSTGVIPVRRRLSRSLPNYLDPAHGDARITIQ